MQESSFFHLNLEPAYDDDDDPVTSLLEGVEGEGVGDVKEGEAEQEPPSIKQPLEHDVQHKLFRGATHATADTGSDAAVVDQQEGNEDGKGR